MKYTAKNNVVLKQILWLDTILGSCTAVVGLAFVSPLSSIFGLTILLLKTILGITLVYAIFAFFLAFQKSTSIPSVRILIFANWTWTIISILLLFYHFGTVTFLGMIFLALQIIVVGGLAYLEDKQIIRNQK